MHLDFLNSDEQNRDSSSNGIEKNKKLKSAKLLPLERFNDIVGSGGDSGGGWSDGGDVDDGLRKRSEDEYIKIANNIVNTSVDQLKDQNTFKKKLKDKFTKFFTRFITCQYIALLGIFIVNMFLKQFALPTEIVIVYISSIFVETLGAIILMIKYAFDSSQETQVLAILNGVISNYQKFKGSYRKKQTKDNASQQDEQNKK